MSSQARNEGRKEANKLLAGLRTNANAGVRLSVGLALQDCLYFDALCQPGLSDLCRILSSGTGSTLPCQSTACTTVLLLAAARRHSSCTWLVASQSVGMLTISQRYTLQPRQLGARCAVEAPGGRAQHRTPSRTWCLPRSTSRRWKTLRRHC